MKNIVFVLALTTLCSGVKADEAKPLPEEVVAFIKNKPVTVQDEAAPLLDTAHKLALDGQHEKAIAIYEYVLSVPVAPNASTPGMAPHPWDYRGEGGWGIAQSLRAQGKWSEALALYRKNREKYPRSDGCVPTGGALQEMMLVEGVCLEHLGRFDEAVQLYWTAARYVDGNSVPSEALRRLYDMYLASGQIDVLEAAIAEESQKALELQRQVLGFDTLPLDERQEKYLASWKAGSFITGCERIQRLRQAATRHKWNEVFAALLTSDGEDYEARGEKWEALNVLIANSKKALPALEKALRQNPDNTNLRAIWLKCVSDEKKKQWLAQPENNHNWGRSEWEYPSYYRVVPLQFVSIPASTKLPTALKVLEYN